MRRKKLEGSGYEIGFVMTSISRMLTAGSMNAKAIRSGIEKLPHATSWRQIDHYLLHIYCIYQYCEDLWKGLTVNVLLFIDFSGIGVDKI